MNTKAIRDRLVERGKAKFQAPKQPVPFTKNAESDALLNDLSNHPHAFVLACLMDRRMKAEKASDIPYQISQRAEAAGLFSGFLMEDLCRLSLEQVNRLMSEPTRLQPLGKKMGGVFHSAAQRISNQYLGDAARIWAGKPSSAEVVYRFLEFEGVGPKIGSMAANILARDFKVPFADHFSIDISPDTHVCRVFARLGLCSADANVVQVIYKARALHPEYPGIIDLHVWEIGREWCKPSKPKCSGCYMKDLCPTANGG
jgi:endonuclease III